MRNSGFDALSSRLSSYVHLDDRELAALRALQSAPQRVRRGTVLVRESEPSRTLFVVQHGAFIASTRLAGGARQILRIHAEGDIANTSCLGWARTAATLSAVTAASVTTVTRQALGTLFVQHPRLAALMHGMSIADTVALSDRLASLGRTDAQARVALLLLELGSRQHTGSPDAPPEDVVNLFLSQAEIADAVGLTKVHVNRVLRRLEADGLITRQARDVRLLQRATLSELCGFVDRYTQLSVDWLPDTHTPSQTPAEFW